MLVATGLSSLHGHHHPHHHHRDYNYNIPSRSSSIKKRQREIETWEMDNNRSRRTRYAASSPYSMPPASAPAPATTMDNSLLLAQDELLYAGAPAAFAPMHTPNSVQVPGYMYSSQIDPAFYTIAQSQPYIQGPTYYPTAATSTSTASTTPAQGNTTTNSQWLHPSHASSSSSRHQHQHQHHHNHNHQPHYQDSLGSVPSDLDYEYDPDMDLDIENIDYDIDLSLSDFDPSLSSPSRSPSTSTSTYPPKHSSSTSSKPDTAKDPNPKDLTLYGLPTQSPGTWRCAYPGCTSPALFRRGCDLRKHYNRHRKHLFCRLAGCPQADPRSPGAGFSSKKDRDRHEAKHNPGIRCEWAGEGCERVFSRVDNMKDHVRRIHQRVG